MEEALSMAKVDLEKDPKEIWNRRAIAWVYYDFLKKYAQPENYKLFKENLEKIKALELPEEEKMVFDKSAYQIGKMIFAFQKVVPVDFSKINEVFELIKCFHFTKPSDAYSYLYKAFHKGYHNWSNYLAFADWWGFENFRSEDCLPDEYIGRKKMAIVEQAYIAYSKKLLEGKPIDPFGQQREIDRDKIQEFIPHLDTIIEDHPEYQYPPYFKAKLLLALGDTENVFSAFIPFAKKKRNDFWVWELMAEIISENEELKFACYCKALSLKTPEDFLVKLRQTFASMLVDKQMYPEAKTDIKKLIATRSKNKWKLPNQVTQWTEQDWFKTAKSKSDNSVLYEKHLKKAEEILYQDIPEEVVVIEFVNTYKNILYFVKDKTKYGFFNYTGQLEKPEIGEILKVRFCGDGQEGFYKVLTAKKASENNDSPAIRGFKGRLKIIPPQNFGFADDVFIPPYTISDNNLEDNMEIEGKAILSFNKKKNEWGWKAIRLN